MKKLYMVFLAALLAVIVAACGSNEASTTADNEKKETKKEETITVQHELGETKVDKNPDKIVVFDFGTLDSMDKLGINVTGVPQDSMPSYLSKYEDKKYENVGGLKEPDFEKISEINPDLIIISGRQADQYDEFTKIAPTIHMGLDTENYMTSFKKNAQTLGEIFGKEAEVEKEVAAVEKTMATVKEEAQASKKNGLIVLVNEGKVSAYGPGSRFGIIHDELGITPVDAGIEASTHGQGVSFEYIVEKNPDYLFVVDRSAVVGGESSAKQALENELIKKTKAYKEGNIVYLDPNYWYLSGGGLLSVAEMAKEIEKAVQ
ncbi:siderophore ABC transporter substrate-binding protein [Priestia flexa]|uniref:Siderophore ABC transporter substrate-binding protein n=1 Tax=Priestia flexa TaxID=86664 RepID=A0ABU4JB41_9BACI|nr:siderophore ABC transporter substrate-binding protein [Priestia flexa]MCM3065704.1 siderophore ABC transporter substrate-binding protein [Priestia flexa]MCP1188848.1 siderophore ABC transporter substrate-binding protein [Priestia flexa]MDW8518194.1 siderophore ABC transporter substrate-binding protein [Priestia flexa]MED4589182.1 siderophore ABC transporter substrate-binding protein [Priestia flexa]